MSSTDLLAILPFLVLAAAAVGVLVVIGVRRDHRLSAAGSAIGLVLAIAAIAVAARYVPRQVTPLFAIDAFVLFYLALILVSALGIALLSYGYLEQHPQRPRDEYYILLLLGTLGAAAMVASVHFAAFFIGLETLSVSLLGLIAYPRAFERPMEAGVKYLILSGVSSAFLLFGIALVYAQFGTMSFAAATPLIQHAEAHDFFWLAGIAMMLTGIGFKLSVVPFHMWAPDVYEGAPAPVAAFVAVVSKVAVFALLLRYLVISAAFQSSSLMLALSVIAVLSMIAGNLLALLQSNVKRILAYSSIAHLGYALVALLASGAFAIEAVSIYLVAYAIMTLGAFGVITLLSTPDQERDADRLADYRGLLWTRPALAVVFAAMLLGLAGIPLTAGFIAKFYTVTAGVGADLPVLVAALVIGSIIGLYYYLRIIVTMALPVQVPEAERCGEVPRLGALVVAVLAVLLVALGVYPGPLITTVRTTAVALATGPDAGKVAVRLGY